MAELNKIENILLVDDEDIACFTSSLILQGMGYTGTIHSAYNGQEALDFLRVIRSKVDFSQQNSLLVLLDINMPIMDGFEFLEALHSSDAQLREHLHIAMITSSIDPQDQQRAARYSLVDFIIKPLSSDKLLHLIRSLPAH